MAWRLFSNCASALASATPDHSAGASSSWGNPSWSASVIIDSAAWLDIPVDCTLCGGLSFEVSHYDDTTHRLTLEAVFGGVLAMPPDDTFVQEALSYGETLRLLFVPITGGAPPASITVVISKF